MSETQRILDEHHRFKKALQEIAAYHHDDGCASDQGSRDGDCNDDHRCYCAVRRAEKALSKNGKVAEKRKPEARCDSYWDGNQCEVIQGHTGKHRFEGWTWVVSPPSTEKET